MLLTLELITHEAGNQKLSRDLLIVLQLLDYCQLLVSLFLILLTSSVAEQNSNENYIGVPTKMINKHSSLLPKKLFK